MKFRYLIILIVLSISIIGFVVAKPVWSICDETANPGCAEDAKSQGYWNFQYDDAAPFTTAGLYCCWWERWYKWQRFGILQNQGNSMNLGSSDSSSLSSASNSNSDSTSNSASGTSAQEQSVETKSFCPSCCANCDDEDMSVVQEKASEIMAKKPWLTEGKSKKVSNETQQTPDEPTGPAVMTFSDSK